MSTTSPKKILVVDDDDDIRALLSQVLRDTFIIQQASGGHEAWMMLQQESFDAVISDIKMPDGSGDELLLKIRQHYGHKMPVILVTAFTDQSREDLLQSGADEVFAKPFSYRMIIQSLNHLMDRSP